jgi:hypothetical protein
MIQLLDLNLDGAVAADRRMTCRRVGRPVARLGDRLLLAQASRGRRTSDGSRSRD